MIEISNLNFHYSRKIRLFEDLSLTLNNGLIYGLLGKNGAGKTSILKLISGLLLPQKGGCIVNGRNTIDKDPQFLTGIYFLPENSFLPGIKIKEYVGIYSCFYPSFDETAFLKYLVDFEIEKDRKLSALSYGQKKKFSIAFALAANTKVLLLDEPTNGLDIPAKSVFRKLVASAINDEKIFIISTHQVRDVKNLIDQIIVLDKGEVIFNQSNYAIEEKLSMYLQKNEPEPGEALFYESTLGGFAVLTRKNEDTESEIEIELLFNSIVAENSIVRKIFEIEVKNEQSV